MSFIASVGDSTSIARCLRWMLAQTRPWSLAREPRSRISTETSCIFAARAFAYRLRLAEPNSRDRYDQRPRSTQETGMTTFWRLPTRMVRLRMRFCRAPTSSSPSTRRILLIGIVDEAQLRDAARLGDLGDVRGARFEGFVQREIVRAGVSVGKQRNDSQVPENGGLAELQAGEGVRKGVHRVLRYADAPSRPPWRTVCRMRGSWRELCGMPVVDCGGGAVPRRHPLAKFGRRGDFDVRAMAKHIHDELLVGRVRDLQDKGPIVLEVTALVLVPLFRAPPSAPR